MEIFNQTKYTKKGNESLDIEKLILITKDGSLLEYDETSPKNINFNYLRLIALTNKTMSYGVLYYP
jgi:hypothetical protein